MHESTFLIFDEIFGSRGEERRNNLLTALRTRIHSYEDYIAGLNKAPKKNIRDGLETGF